MNVLEEVLEDRARAIQLQSANDYRAYRHLKSKQLARSRRELKIQVRPHKADTKKSKPKPVTSDQFVEDIRYGRVLINNAERAWGTAMESKAVQETKKSQFGGSKRRHVISKLAKALKFTEEMVKGLESVGLSDVEKLEIYGYKGLIEGALRFEQKNWAQAIDAFSLARVVMQIRGTETMKDVLTSTVDPALGYAVYQSKRSRSVDIPTLAKQTVASSTESTVVDLIRSIDSSALEVGSSKQDPSARLGEIQWRNHSARVANPDLASAILAAKEKESTLQVGKISTFDNVLQGWQDALDIVKESIEELESVVNRSHDETSQHQYIISTFINYRLLFTRIQRDLLLIKKIKSPSANSSNTRKLEYDRDLIRINDTILQSTNQLLHLPGVTQDEELQLTLNSLEKYFKARRSSLVAHAYSIQNDRPSALALYKLASDTINDGVTSLKTELPGNVVRQEQIDAFKQQLKQQFTKAHALAVLSQTSTGPSDGNDTAVVDSLDRYANGSPEQVLSRLVELDPKLRPAPVKPVYFDIAFNYVDYDDEATKADANSSTQAPSQPPASSSSQEEQESGKKSGGLFGLFGGGRR